VMDEYQEELLEARAGELDMPELQDDADEL
jgi:hypothetical protein